MKVRNGFVSNSSSSSFIVGVKKGEKLTEKLLLRLFKVPEDSPLYSFAKDVAKVALEAKGPYRSFEELVRNAWEYDSLEQYEDDYPRRERRQEEDWFDEGFKLYYGRVSTDDWDYPAEVWLCRREIDCENDKLIFSSQGGY